MSTVSSVTPSTETGFRAFVKRHPLISMYSLMLLLAWPFLIIDALASQGRISTPPVNLMFATGWAPGLAAVVVSAVIAGRQGVRDLLRRFLVWRVGLSWYLVAVFLMALIILGGIWLNILFDGTMSRLPPAGASIVSVTLRFLILVVPGVLLNTEEIAWRGFALPRLQARFGALTACALLAIPEAVFHLPYFWNKNAVFYQNVGIFWITAFTIAAVLIYVFIFNMTKGSLLFVTLLHASLHAWSNILSDNTLGPFQFTIALIWMVALALIFLTKGQLGYESD